MRRGSLRGSASPFPGLPGRQSSGYDLISRSQPIENATGFGVRAVSPPKPAPPPGKYGSQVLEERDALVAPTMSGTTKRASEHEVLVPEDDRQTPKPFVMLAECLPDDWVEYIHHESQHRFFVNYITKETRWTDPRDTVCLACSDQYIPTHSRSTRSS